MRVAVISDIHANLHALETVLGDVDRESVDEIWCLGDVVGYGPRPNECCDLIRDRAAISLCGNHDLAVLGALDVGEFSGDAAAAARWTAGILASEQRAWLHSLAPLARRDDVELFHASPRDPVWEYVLSEEVALLSLEATTEPLVLVGHTHVALALTLENGRMEGGLAPGGVTVGLQGRRFIVNPGSVGQPRDGDARAAWLLLDTDEDTASFRRVTYPIERTQKEMRDAGLPETLAGRLAHGL
ncbi:MAG TPA: metallophosphoesterase family protein [Gaiellaceae bacterium]|nr:metallophosphoesterase family protein [Gaiellaceae bacterium]